MKNRLIPENDYPVIKGVKVDIKSLLSLSHSCDPGKCSSGRSCCSFFKVCIEQDELMRIIGYMPAASAYSKRLSDGGRINNVFDELGPRLYSIDTDETGLCEFAYRAGRNRTLCSLHTAALEMDHRPEAVKPRECVLWPLALSEERPFYLSMDNYALTFPCNSLRDRDTSSLDPGVAAIIRNLFGNDFLNAVNMYIG